MAALTTRAELIAALRADAADWQQKLDGTRRMLRPDEQVRIESLIVRLRRAAELLDQFCGQ